MKRACARSRFRRSGSILGFTAIPAPRSTGLPPPHPDITRPLEGLEQLRFLENGWRIDTIPVEVPPHLLSGIDTPEDLAKAEQAIACNGDPFPG